MTQCVFEKRNYWVRGQKERMHNEEKREGVKEEEPMKRRKKGTKRMKRKQPGRVLERMEEAE